MTTHEAEQRREAHAVAQDMSSHIKFRKIKPEDLKGECDYTPPVYPDCVGCHGEGDRDTDCAGCPVNARRTFGELRAVRAICVFGRALKLRHIDHIAGAAYLITYPDSQHIGTWDDLMRQLPEVKNLFLHFAVKKMELTTRAGKILVERITSMD